MRKIALVFALSALSMDAYAKDKKQELSGLELQQVQTRDYETKSDVVFPAVLTVLQDSGYIIQSADKTTGLITANGSSKSATTFNLFWGWGKKKKTPYVSAFVEQRGPVISRVRLNFVLSESKSRVYGVSSADEEMITDPAVYRDAFERIDKEIFVRAAMDAPTPPAVPTQPAPAPMAAEPQQPTPTSGTR